MQIPERLKINKHYRAALYDTVLISFFTVLPTLFGLLAAQIKDEYFDDSKLYKTGELLLYSVSFLSSAYIIYEQKKYARGDWRINISRVIIITLIIISGMFAFLSVTTNPNLSFIKTTSFLALLIGTVLLFFSQVEMSKDAPDVGQIRSNEQENIADQLV